MKAFIIERYGKKLRYGRPKCQNLNWVRMTF